MRRNRIRRTLLLLMSAFALSATAAAAQTKTVVVVRHAEKADDSADPVLSAAGEERSRALVQVLQDRGVGAIFTTQYQRTVLTAAPLAASLRITPTVVAAGGDHVADVAARVRASAADVVLVVGHSNTVPAIVRALSGEAVDAIEDNEYGNIYEVTLSPDGAKVKRGWYGRALEAK
jgi:broad specificity phosphatase PhoE